MSLHPDSGRTFQDRVNAAFGALHSSTGPSADWTLQQEQIYRNGKAAEYSSEEEEEAKQAEADRKDLLPNSLLDFQENEQGIRELPSNAFCKALDNEEEYDANDALASGVNETKQEKRPPRHMEQGRLTQVLDDNVFEVGSRVREAAAAPASERMEVDGLPKVVPEQQVEQQSRAASYNVARDPQGAAKRVRFAEPFASDRPFTSKVQQTRESAGPRRKQRGDSYVPDHVRHPEKYTVYTLDEPITVGSGDSGLSDGGRPDNAQAARAAQAASAAQRKMDVDEDGSASVELPAFGAGIDFKPSGRQEQRGLAKSSGAAGRAIKATAALPLGSSEDTGDDSQIQEAAGPGAEGAKAKEFQARSQRNRNLRSRRA